MFSPSGTCTEAGSSTHWRNVRGHFSSRSEARIPSQSPRLISPRSSMILTRPPVAAAICLVFARYHGPAKRSDNGRPFGRRHAEDGRGRNDHIAPGLSHHLGVFSADTAVHLQPLVPAQARLDLPSLFEGGGDQ